VPRAAITAAITVNARNVVIDLLLGTERDDATDRRSRRTKSQQLVERDR
jgi:hypothetical protein